MRQLAIGDVECVVLADALDLLAQKYRTVIAEGKREGLRNPEIERRLEAIIGNNAGESHPDTWRGIRERIGDPDPVFAERLRKGWTPILEDERVTKVGPMPGTEAQTAGM